VDLDFIFGALMDTPGMHIYCGSSVSSPKDLEVAPIMFKWLKSDHGKWNTFKHTLY
jgi:hypothetical protein